jgi:hypothetical protein
MYDVTDYSLDDLLCLLDAEREQAAMFRRIASNVPSSRLHARDVACAEASEALAALCEAELARRGVGA